MSNKPPIKCLLQIEITEKTPSDYETIWKSVDDCFTNKKVQLNDKSDNVVLQFKQFSNVRGNYISLQKYEKPILSKAIEQIVKTLETKHNTKIYHELTLL